LSNDDEYAKEEKLTENVANGRQYLENKSVEAI
jgi:hypothetical protein